MKIKECIRWKNEIPNLRKLLYVVVLAFGSDCYSQIKDLNEFFAFANLNHEQRIEFLNENNWKKTGYKIEEHFGSYYIEELMFKSEISDYDEISLQYIIEMKDTLLEVKLSLTEDVYNLWVKKLKSSGYEFFKDSELEGLDIYNASMENDPNFAENSTIGIQKDCSEGECRCYISVKTFGNNIKEVKNEIENTGEGIGKKEGRWFRTTEGETYYIDKEAEFIGGSSAMYKWISENVQYPQTAVKSNTEGKVYVSFNIEVDGSITNVRVNKSVSEDLDKEAVRLFSSMPRWTPAKSKGKAVKSLLVMPIKFSL